MRSYKLGLLGAVLAGVMAIQAQAKPAYYIAPPTADMSNAILFTYPQGGDILGSGYYTHLSPDPFVHGTLTIGMSNAPKLILKGLIATNAITLWQDNSGNLLVATNDSTASILRYSKGEYVYAPQGVSIAAEDDGSNTTFGRIWTQGGDVNISTTGTNGSVKLFANGTGSVQIESSVQFSGYTATPSLCGSLANSTGCFTFLDQTGAKHYVPAY